MRIQNGTILKNKWTIDSPLGSGGMATVYSATHRNGSRVAIKMLRPEISKIEEMCRRFLREGYAANAVEHPGVVRVYDDDIAEDGAVFLVMELLEGEPLDVFWKRNGRKLQEHQVLTITDQILDVLIAAHEKEIIHRDVKPQNIFLLKSGGLKILDFGIARLRENANAAQATMTGAFMGTPAYVPPEQARARWELVDRRSDLWAVGATMYVLLTGKLVHAAGTMNEQLLAAMTQSAPSIARLRPDLPECIQRVVDRALQYERDDRWPDARTMQGAVREALREFLSGAAANAIGRETIALPTHVAPRKSIADKHSSATCREQKAEMTPSIEVVEVSIASASIPTPSNPPAPTGLTEMPIARDVGSTQSVLDNERTKFARIVVGIPIFMILGAVVFWFVTNRTSSLDVQVAAAVAGIHDSAAIGEEQRLVTRENSIAQSMDSAANHLPNSPRRENVESGTLRALISGATNGGHHAPGAAESSGGAALAAPIASATASAVSAVGSIVAPPIVDSAPIEEPPPPVVPTPSISLPLARPVPIPAPPVVPVDDPLDD